MNQGTGVGRLDSLETMPMNGGSKESLEFDCEHGTQCLLISSLSEHLFADGKLADTNPSSELHAEAERWILARGSATEPGFELDSHLGAKAAEVWGIMQKRAEHLCRLQKAEADYKPQLESTRTTAEQFRHKIMNQAKCNPSSSEQLLAKIKHIDHWEQERVVEFEKPLKEISDTIDELQENIDAALSKLIEEASVEFRSARRQDNNMVLDLAKDLEAYLRLDEVASEGPLAALDSTLVEPPAEIPTPAEPPAPQPDQDGDPSIVVVDDTALLQAPSPEQAAFAAISQLPQGQCKTAMVKMLEVSMESQAGYT